MNQFITLLCLFFSVHVISQVPDWKVVQLDQDINITNFVQDSLGFMWLSSADELYRFDGLSTELKYKMAGGEISSIYYHEDGLFYIGSSEGSLNQFNPYNSKKELFRESTIAAPITDIHIVNKDDYVLLFYGQGLILSIDGKEMALDLSSGLMSNEVYEVEYFKGDYYVSNDQGIQVIRIKESEYVLDSYTIKDGLPDIIINQLASDGNQLWYSDYQQNVGFIGSNGIVQNVGFDEVKKINDLIISNERVYVATDQGLFQIEENSWQKKYPIEGLGKVEHVVVDEEENLWIVLVNSKLAKGHLKFQKELIDMQEGRAISKFADLFIVGKESGLYSYEKGKERKINNKNITYLSIHDEYLLVGTFADGVLVYDAKLNLIDQIDEWRGIPRESVLSISSHENNIYVSSLSGLMLFKQLEGKLIVGESLNEKIGRDYIYCIHAFGDHLLFGTDRHGLISWNMKSDHVEKITLFSTGEKIGSVYSITHDDSGVIWFSSTEFGLGSIDGDAINYFNHDITRSANYTCVSLLPDGKILLIRKESFDLLNCQTKELAFYEQEVDSKKQADYLNAIVEDTSGFYFVHNDNIFTYTPSNGGKSNPGILIDKVLVNLTEVEGRNVFNENECNIEFNYKGLWLSDPTKIRYKYKLEGFDNEWRESNNTSVSFPKLVPGEYKFRLMASQNGFFNEKSATSFDFTIKQHWYNLLLVRLLGLLALVLLGFGILRNREGRKREKEALEKLKIENQLINLKNQLNPHFLFNGFNTLIGLIEEDSPKSVAFVEGMTDYYRSMLDLGKVDMVSLEKELELLDQYVGILKARFNGQLQIDKEIDDTDGYFLPPFTLQMLMENAVKHNVVSTKNPLKIRIEKRGDCLIFWNKKNQLISASKGTNTGLDNINKRFLLAGMKKLIINNTDEHYEVILNPRKK